MVSEQSIRWIPSTEVMWETQPVALWWTYEGCARQLFDGLSTRNIQQEAASNPILSVTIRQLLYPTTVEVLHQIFYPYGVVEAMEIFRGKEDVVVLVNHASCHGATQALETLQCRNIYDGCCQLDIKYAPVQEQEMGDAHHLLDNLSTCKSPCEASTLCVGVYPVLYPVTEDMLYKLFDAYGVGQKMQMFESLDCISAASGCSAGSRCLAWPVHL